jgi:hypothetical protein
MGLTIVGSSFSSLFTRVEIGHMHIARTGKAALGHSGPAPRPAGARGRRARMTLPHMRLM